MGAGTIVSLQEFERLAAEEGTFYELDEGEIIAMSAGRRQHGKVQNTIGFLLNLWLAEHRGGAVYQAETGFLLGDDPPTVRVPDAAFVHAERDLESPEGYVLGAPDLAVEVVSPTDSASYLVRKVRQYLKHGGHTVWVVYPETREVHVFEASGAIRVVGEEQVLEAPELLPGFAVPVARLFE